MKLLTVRLAVVLLMATGPAVASEALAKKNNCIGCHHMTEKKVGPTWNAIAGKNRGVPDAEKALTDFTVKGGKDKYGKVAMPPQPKAKADAAKIVKWIMSL